MIPLKITATVPGPVSLPNHRPMLDALLMAAVAVRDGLPPPSLEMCQIGIPVLQEQARGIYLCTEAQYVAEEYDRHWINRRFPIEEAQALGEVGFTRVLLGQGPTKSFRIPLEVCYLRDAQATWWCLGEDAPIRELLTVVTHLGKKRSVGKGEITSWSVEQCDTWPGFPVLRDGAPLRALPLDWPGVVAADRGMRVLAPPYWERWRESECLVPMVAE